MASPSQADEVRSTSRTGVGAPSKSGRRKACNQCKQQKLRCDLTTVAREEEDAPNVACSRCKRLSLECRVDTDFRRVRKRRRSFDMEKEIQSLRRELRNKDQAQSQPQGQAPLTPTPYAALDWNLGLSETSLLPVPSPSPNYGPRTVAESPASAITTDQQQQLITRAVPTPPTAASSTAASGPSLNTTEHSRAPGLTTRPGVDEPSEPQRRPGVALAPRPRALGNIALSVEEIEELFLIYFANYHPFLPILDMTKSPHDLYASSELLFWSIISVASRRLRSRPTLLPKLARAVTDLSWCSIRAIPYSLSTVQALALLCTWPFPTSSSTADPTFVLTGIMMQLGVQMGIHRVFHVQDFIKVTVRLSASEHAECIRTWEGCNIVAQSVSAGCGLPLMIHMHDWSLSGIMESTSSTAVDLTLRQHLRIEQFRHRVSQSLGTNVLCSPDLLSSDRLSLYRLFNVSLVELESEILGPSAAISWYLSAARLHLQAFYLLDDASGEGYDERILTLFNTACTLIGLSQELNSNDSNGPVGSESEHTFFAYCPFFCYQVFVCAAFVILKILDNGFFRPLIDADAGRKLLDSAIVWLRVMSVVNNDLPARLGDVIGFFCTLPEQGVLGGSSREDLRLREVKNRLSMSVVYDSLWIWRKQFRTTNTEEDATTRSERPQPLVEDK